MHGRIGRLGDGFCVTWTEDGKRRRYRLAARTRATAEAEARDVILRNRTRPADASVSDLWAAYTQDAEGRRIARNMAQTGRIILPLLGHLRPDQITPDDCRAHTAKRRAQGLSDSTIRTELNHLRIVLNWSVKRRLIAWAPDIPRPAEPAPRDRWLTDAEIARLLAAPCDPHIRLAMLLMLGTAGRIGAILGLTWARVDLDRGVIDLRADDSAIGGDGFPAKVLILGQRSRHQIGTIHGLASLRRFAAPRSNPLVRCGSPGRTATSAGIARLFGQSGNADRAFPVNGLG